jgi:hypothetical protein
LRREELPVDIRTALDDPDRPKATSAYDFRDVFDPLIHGKNRWSKQDGTFPSYQEARTARDVWAAKELARVGLPSDTYGDDSKCVVRDGERFTQSGFKYTEAVYTCLYNVFRAEAAATKALNVASEDEWESFLDAIPTDGEGLDMASLVEVSGRSRETVRKRVAELVEDGKLRVVYVATSVGGAKKRLYFRVDPDADPEDV